jgi:hypothetical protein
VANLISVPLQNNFNFGAGVDPTTALHSQHPARDSDQTREEWNLITRTIMLVINQPSLPRRGYSPGFATST